MKSRPGEMEETHPLMWCKMYSRAALDLGTGFVFTKAVLQKWIDEHNEKVGKESPTFKLTSWKREVVEALMFKYGETIRDIFQKHTQKRLWERCMVNVRLLRFNLKPGFTNKTLHAPRGFLEVPIGNHDLKPNLFRRSPARPNSQ